MKTSYVLRFIASSVLLVSLHREAAAQTEVGAQVDLFSSYVWRGVSA